jgi:hypothetical protein
MTPSNEPNRTPSQFERLLAGLARNGIDFAVVGGLAVILNGYPRLTLDADILVQNSPENLHCLLDYLKTWGEGWARELKVEDFNVDQGAVRISEDFDLDIFTSAASRSTISDPTFGISIPTTCESLTSRLEI